VRAGMCHRPADWPWSTYGETIGRRFPRPFVASTALLRIFGEDISLARARYQAFVEQAIVDRPCGTPLVALSSQQGLTPGVALCWGVG